MLVYNLTFLSPFPPSPRHVTTAAAACACANAVSIVVVFAAAQTGLEHARAPAPAGHREADPLRRSTLGGDACCIKPTHPLQCRQCGWCTAAPSCMSGGVGCLALNGTASDSPAAAKAAAPAGPPPPPSPPSLSWAASEMQVRPSGRLPVDPERPRYWSWGGVNYKEDICGSGISFCDYFVQMPWWQGVRAFANWGCCYVASGLVGNDGTNLVMIPT